MNAHNLTGNIYGNLTILSRAGQKQNNGNILWLCQCVCGNTKIIDGQHLKRGMTKSCGCFKNRKGNNAAHWKGGKTKHQRGYICVYKPEHPHCDNHGYVFEHRLVMEEKLGRLLLKTEVVHHTNGDVTDNCLENLKLFNGQGDHIRHHRKNVCKKGHEFTIQNSRIRKNGWRVCRICAKERNAKYKATSRGVEKSVNL